MKTDPNPLISPRERTRTRYLHTIRGPEPVNFTTTADRAGPVYLPARAAREKFCYFLRFSQGIYLFCARRGDPEPINCTQRTRTRYCTSRAARDFLTFFSDFQGKTEHFCVRREDPEPINCTQRTRTYCLHLRAQRAIFFYTFCDFQGKTGLFCA